MKMLPSAKKRLAKLLQNKTKIADAGLNSATASVKPTTSPSGGT